MKQQNRSLWSIFFGLCFIVVLIINYKEEFNNLHSNMSLKSVISDDIEESKQNAKREQIVYSFLDKSVLYNELEFIPGIESYRNDVFKQKLDRKCKPWYDLLNSWKRDLIDQNISENLVAFQEYSGFGDRLMGIQGALVNSIELNSQLQIDWLGLTQFLIPTEFIQNSNHNYYKNQTKRRTHKSYLDMSYKEPGTIFEMNSDKYWSGYRETKCEDQIYWRCDKLLHKNRKCDVYNRACSGEKTCKSLTTSEYVPPPVEFIGCPLRMVLKFNSSFLNSQEKVGFIYLGGNKQQESSIEDFIKRISKEKKKIVVIHLRLGDTVLKLKNKEKHKEEDKRKGIFDNTKLQSNGLTYLEETLLKNSYSCFEDSIIIFTSDSQRLRRYVKTNEEYSKRTIMLTNEPFHISDLSSITSEQQRNTKLLETFIEWFLIYISDELVTNSGHIFGISAFSRSARLFGLNSRYYLVSSENETKCTKEKFQYDGNIRKVRTICKKYST